MEIWGRLRAKAFVWPHSCNLNWTWHWQSFLKNTAFCAPLSQKESNIFSSLKCYRPFAMQCLACLHVLWVKYAKISKKIEKSENVATYRCFSLVQRCSLNFNIKVFHYHHKYGFYAKQPYLITTKVATLFLFFFSWTI